MTKGPQLYFCGRPVSKEEMKDISDGIKALKDITPKKKPVGVTRIALAKILCHITENVYRPEDIRQISNQYSGSENKKKGNFRMGFFDPCSWMARPDTDTDKYGSYIACPHAMKDVVKHWKKGGVIELKNSELSIISDSFDINSICWGILW